MKILLPTLVLGMAMEAAAEPPERAAWLRDHAVVVRTVDPADDDFSDLRPLVDLIGSARVVQLGEATHGDGVTFLAKARLIRFLHQVMGFDVLAWEAGFFDCRDVDVGLRSPQVPLHEAGARGLYGLWWRAAEVRPLLAYVRRTWSTDRPITTVGFDCRVATEEGRAERFPRFVFDFFDRLDPELISAAERRDLTAMSVGLVPQDYHENPGPRDYNRALPRRLAGVIDVRRGDLLRFYGPWEIDYARQALVSLMNMDRALEGGEDGYSRDAAMAENLLWWVEGPLAGRKVVVWAHNYHVQEGVLMPDLPYFQRPFASPAGRFLSDALGDALYTVGFLSFTGASGWIGATPEPLPEFAPDSLEALLHAAGRPYLWVDLLGLPEDHWLRSPLGASFMLYQQSIPTDWSRLYDAVFFIDVQRPPTLLPELSGG